MFAIVIRNYIKNKPSDFKAQSLTEALRKIRRKSAARPRPAVTCRGCAEDEITQKRP